MSLGMRCETVLVFKRCFFFFFFGGGGGVFSNLTKIGERTFCMLMFFFAFSNLTSKYCSKCVEAAT